MKTALIIVAIAFYILAIIFNQLVLRAKNKTIEVQSTIIKTNNKIQEIQNEIIKSLSDMLRLHYPKEMEEFDKLEKLKEEL